MRRRVRRGVRRGANERMVCERHIIKKADSRCQTVENIDRVQKVYQYLLQGSDGTYSLAMTLKTFVEFPEKAIKDRAERAPWNLKLTLESSDDIVVDCGASGHGVCFVWVDGWLDGCVFQRVYKKRSAARLGVPMANAFFVTDIAGLEVCTWRRS